MKRIAGPATAVMVLALASPAHAQSGRAKISPYIEVSQVVTTDSGDGSGDVLTYTQLSAGVDGSMHTRRIEAEISYRFDQRIDWQKHSDVDQIHSGLARIAGKITPNLQVEGGAIATLGRTDIRGATGSTLSGSGRNLSQVYSGYVGPTFNAQAGAFGIAASYRYGYTKVDLPDSTGVVAGSFPIDAFSDSRSQVAQASIGAKAGTFLPVGVSLSGAWQKENVGQLDQKYNGKYARADVVVPVSPTVAVVAGAGYEDIKITQRDPLVTATGAPVTDSRGRYVVDPNSPARIAYDTTGLFWDAGVIWRPSRRTTLTARVGRRYDSMSYTGSFSHETGNGSGFQIGVYDGIQSFGRQLRDGVAALPTDFAADNNGLGAGFSGCTFGTGNGGGDNAAGGCLNSAFQSITSSNYRARGVDGVYVLTRGPNSFGLGGGYANRRYFAPTIGAGAAFSVDGIVDESYYAQLMYGRQMGRDTSFNASLYANYSNPGAPGAEDVTTAGGVASLSRRFGRIGAFASLGVYWVDQGDGYNDVAGQAQAGMRYQF